MGHAEHAVRRDTQNGQDLGAKTGGLDMELNSHILESTNILILDFGHWTLWKNLAKRMPQTHVAHQGSGKKQANQQGPEYPRILCYSLSCNLSQRQDLTFLQETTNKKGLAPLALTIDFEGMQKQEEKHGLERITIRKPLPLSRGSLPYGYARDAYHPRSNSRPEPPLVWFNKLNKTRVTITW